MKRELIMAQQTKHDSMFEGEWYQQQARKAFSILVQRAKARETITYKELGEALGLNKYFMSLRTVFSNISAALADLQASWQGGNIPLIISLVTKANGRPNQFICAQLTGDPERAPTQEEYDAVLEVIYSYPNWDAILREFGLEGSATIGTQESERITSLRDFIEWIGQLELGNYLFRGVSNSEYEIRQASAYRRLGEKPTLAKLIEINKSIIEQARRRGYNLKNGRALSDLEILCEMQHFRVATCLIDFTRSAEVALWFACSSSSDKQLDGKVIAVRNDLSIKEVTSGMLERKIDYFFKEDEIEGYPLYQWQPTHLNYRIIRQHSVFLFGGGEIESSPECLINGTDKEKIRRELERFSNISEDTLFPDFEGFARLHAHNVPHTIPNYKRIANEAYQKGDYPKAIANYVEAIRLDPDDAWLYYMQGRANFGHGQYDEAITDYDEAIQLLLDFPEAYYWRGRAKHLLERYDEAITDYDEAIQLLLDFPEAYYWRGRAKHLLERYDEAITDYDEAIRLDANNLHAYCYRAKAKMEIGELTSAQPDLRLALLLAKKTGDAKLIQEINEDISKIKRALEDNIPL